METMAHTLSSFRNKAAFCRQQLRLKLLPCSHRPFLELLTCRPVQVFFVNVFEREGERVDVSGSLFSGSPEQEIESARSGHNNSTGNCKVIAGGHDRWVDAEFSPYYPHHHLLF